MPGQDPPPEPPLVTASGLPGYKHIYNTIFLIYSIIDPESPSFHGHYNANHPRQRDRKENKKTNIHRVLSSAGHHLVNCKLFISALLHTAL